MRKGEFARILVAAAAVLVLVSSPLLAVHGQITNHWHPTPPPNQQFSDVWGYAPGDGQYYAFLGELGEGPGDINDTLYVYNVTDPENINLVCVLGDFPSVDFKSRGHYLYGVDHDNEGVDGKIVDITNPGYPVPVGSPFKSGHNITISDNGYMFISRNEVPRVEGAASMWVYNIAGANATAPESTWAEDFRVGTLCPDAVGIGWWIEGHDATAKGNRLYEFAFQDGVKVWDLSTIAQWAPQEQPIDLIEHGWARCGAPYRGESAHSGDVTSDHRYLYICDEAAYMGAHGPRPGDIYVWDITDLGNSAPSFVDSIADPTTSVHNLYIVDDLVFVSNYAAGFRVYDASNPGQGNLDETLIDEYDTAPGQSGQGLMGAWGVYPFDPRGYVYVSDITTGLHVFQVEGYDGPPTQASVTGRIVDVAGNGVGGVSLEFNETGGAITYATSGPGGGYSMALPLGWTGIVTPVDAVHSFSFYTNGGPVADYTFGLTSELAGQDFTACEIMGSIAIDDPDPGVILRIGNNARFAADNGAACPFETFDYYLSRDGGQNWVLLTSTPNPTYYWPVQSPVSNDCYLKITATSPTNVSTAISGQFAIDYPSCAKCPNIEQGVSGLHPAVTRLLGATPNPFNPTTRVRFDLATSEYVSIEVYDVRGAEVRSVDLGIVGAGQNQWEWDGRDGSGGPLASGVYFIVFRAGDFVQKSRALLLK